LVLNEDGESLGLQLAIRMSHAAVLVNEARDGKNVGGRSALFNEAYRNYCERERRGEALDPDEYCARYPSIKSSLARCLQVHQFAVENPALFTGETVPFWPEPGSRFLDFHLEALLGEGSFARVYLATQPELADRRVAVKVSRHGAGEARTLARAGHPNVVPIYSIATDTATGLTAICMPYLGSATLHDVLNRATAETQLPDSAASILAAIAESAAYPDLENAPENSSSRPMPADVSYAEAIRWLLLQLLDALAFIHARGIVHRDLKPSNVLLTSAGVPMLLDFNLSADDRQSGNPWGGTPLYMAPEQLLAFDSGPYAGPGTPDPRTDLFALGVLGYELLTGCHPFIAEPLKLAGADLRGRLLQAQQRDLVPLRERNPAVAPDLARVIERCLSFAPQSRPATASAAADALRVRPAPKRPTPLRRTLAATALLGLFALGAVLPFPLTDQRAGAWEQGLEAHRQERYSDAVNHFSVVLQEDPAKLEALLARGKAWQALGQKNPDVWERARADFESAESRAPSGRTKALLAHVLLLQNHSSLAQVLFERALQFNYETAPVLNNLAYLEIKKHQLDQAARHLERALELDPFLSQAYHNRSQVALQRAYQNGNVANPIQHAARAMWLSLGLKDVEQALKLGPQSGVLFYDAARLSVAVTPRDDARNAQTVAYLSGAVEHGIDARRLETERLWDPLSAVPSFVELRRQAPRPAFEQPRPVVDMLDD
jgi:serine/threonine protein kinase/Tfp pilus assembly protein PilF